MEGRITSFIRDCVEKSNSKGVVLGLSGGVDSAVVAFLCVKALGKERVLANIMPEEGVTPKEDVEDALLVAKILGIEYNLIEISPIVSLFLNIIGKDRINKNSLINLKPRIRMAINYFFANALQRLVVGTGNKSEIMIGYFTKYGDGGVDLQPIGDLYKTEIFEFARYLGVPERIVKKRPTAGLYIGQTDEDEIGMSYAELDEILKKIELGIFENEERFKRVLELVRASEHKRAMPPIPRVRDLL
uniref:NH(3)-dependent NAD(+) synthetase n=1 Tax=Archaeoglobus fulgidus TaxID=2234 RepID=A0A7J2TK45_ARCFL